MLLERNAVCTIIVTTAERPEFVPTVAAWLWEVFWRDSGKPFETLCEASHRTAARDVPIPRTFVFLDGEIAIGTASLIESDLDERRDLSPWLAGVFVKPDARKKSVASHLVRAVEDCARSVGATTLWLHTKTEGFYARLGWQQIEQVATSGASTVLMRRDL